MKIRYLAFFIAVAAGLFSCKDPAPNSAIVGKWQETKLRLYQTDSSGALVYDTTYLEPFTSYDYIQFYYNGTCSIGSDHYYYPNVGGNPRHPQAISPTAYVMNYMPSGQKYILTQPSTLVNPGGFDIRDTVSIIDANTLRFNSVFYPHLPGYTTYTDAYYTRK